MRWLSPVPRRLRSSRHLLRLVVAEGGRGRYRPVRDPCRYRGRYTSTRPDTGAPCAAWGTLWALVGVLWNQHRPISDHPESARYLRRDPRDEQRPAPASEHSGLRPLPRVRVALGTAARAASEPSSSTGDAAGVHRPPARGVPLENYRRASERGGDDAAGGQGSV